jgi:antitoxin VapB
MCGSSGSTLEMFSEAYPLDISKNVGIVSGMNAPSEISREAALFRSNRSQAVRIPKDLEFPTDLKKVVVRRVGKAIMLVPKGAEWDMFLSMLPADDDFVAPDDPPPLDEIAPL